MAEIVKNLLRKYKIRPSKRFGQNFLIDKIVLKKIVATANLQPRDIILEIGPGTGILTKELAKKVKKVIAIEKDPEMVKILQEATQDLKNVKIIQGDILELNPKRYNLKPKTYKVVANLPYYITSPVIRKFLELPKARPRIMVLMVQKEVAQRITAKPPNMNLLAVSVQFYAKPNIMSYVSKRSFWPQSKVDSAIIKIVPHKSALIGINYNLFFEIVRAGFSQPRKQLINNLSRLNFSSKNLGGQAKYLKIHRQKIKNWLLKNKIQPDQRAETLSIRDWLKLTGTFRL
ncbi:MAG: ribosomal RNA small subunit methyltransferase A [Candidatus Nealsonbacteria bacterium RBG_13_36_15]|uniref:Ribosomal RNA small subunit methyltransferase A n=1 Tax=Candidatus Nealsonbacteria bacterium RBG_13_36_15 TaxID=1801660 RepID=A0A1G2DXA5_9BACT|nr:MAG: ribosomal RNA small subunit methyltransferase A [Candidatus Nealsonbacteria bacterium RBG_13_36_15]